MACVAHHEAGHAVATVLAWRYAIQPNRLPDQLVNYAEIFKPEPLVPNSWAGICYGTQVYMPEWSEDRIADQFRDAMEWQIIVELAGGIAEAIYQGEWRKHRVLGFAAFNCGADNDLDRSAELLADLRRLTRRKHREQQFAEAALALLLEYWPAVEAVGAALIEHKRIEGHQVEEIVDRLRSENTIALRTTSRGRSKRR
jgi:hypothetical protein